MNCLHRRLLATSGHA